MLDISDDYLYFTLSQDGADVTYKEYKESLDRYPGTISHHDRVKEILNFKNKQGKEKKESFVKFDSEKPDYSLFEPIIMKAYCNVGTMGAKKYGRNNWKNSKLEDYPRYVAAEYRHDMAAQSGEQFDPESGLPHLWHKLWNVAARIYLEERYGYEECLQTLRGEK